MGMRNTNLSATRRARTLRKDMSNTERRLRRVVRHRALGWRFRRQFPVGSFTLDFYCPALRLAVEVDGTHHNNRKHLDAARDAYLLAQGNETIRFSALDVIENLEGVYTRLETVCRKRSDQLGCTHETRRDRRRAIRANERRKAPPP